MSDVWNGSPEMLHVSPDSIGLDLVNAYNASYARELHPPTNKEQGESRPEGLGRFGRLRTVFRHFGADSTVTEPALREDDEPETLLDKQKQAFAQRMESFTPLQRAYFVRELASTAKARPFLRQGLSREMQEEDVIPVLQELDVTGTPESSAFVLNALQFHLYSYGKLNKNPELIAQIDKRRDNFREGVIRGVQGNWLDASALTRLETQREVPIYLGDIASTTAANYIGYYSRTQDYAVISAFGFPDSKGLKSVEHELGHARIEDNSDPEEGYYFDSCWYLSESLVEHGAMVAKQQADPEGFTLHEGEYKEYRGLIDTTLALGRLRGVDIGVEDLSRVTSMRQVDRTGWLQSYDARLTRAIPEFGDCGSIFIGMGAQIKMMASNPVFYPELDAFSRRFLAADMLNYKMRDLVEVEYNARFARARNEM